MNLKEFLREVRQTHDANIANTYVAKSDVDFDATDLADVFANAGASSATQTGSNKITPTLNISPDYEYDGDGSAGTFYFPYTYNGDGEIFAKARVEGSENNDATQISYGRFSYPDDYIGVCFVGYEPYPRDCEFDLILHATEGDNYAAATTTLHVISTIETGYKKSRG